ncbi:hypothetical protein [Sabulicella glaciei]|uniref:Uncharacterized protein n=1 Tax=Sabulicella glaciei TaxID=2984948 RepID=A0ABT3NWQ8_9PROT|nr:hypothetical protein [Roseococcus sp. MDT2-1-1]MCW8086610.1 hypothetical protein [Roseococcus sp. MDT2-1-1]
MSRPDRITPPLRAPLAASEEPARRVLLPGLETPSGGPVEALATGHPRRPVLHVLGGLGALLAASATRGDA